MLTTVYVSLVKGDNNQSKFNKGTYFQVQGNGKLIKSRENILKWSNNLGLGNLENYFPQGLNRH
jgi:hypothetical protein